MKCKCGSEQIDYESVCLDSYRCRKCGQRISGMEYQSFQVKTDGPVIAPAKYTYEEACKMNGFYDPSAGHKP